MDVMLRKSQKEGRLGGLFFTGAMAGSFVECGVNEIIKYAV